MSYTEKKQMMTAIKNREFKAYKQAIVDAKNSEVVGGEALARWDHPERGLLNPGHFIEIMLRSGAISALDLYMFEEACKQQKIWQNSGRKMFLTCNFTRVTISEKDFAEKVESVMRKYNIDYEYIVIEITEDTSESNAEVAFANIAKCKALGLTIALDDMGSGTSSFEDFNHYPVDIVKIDRSILLNATTENGKATLREMISLAHKLNAKVLCEGVETKEQAELLKDLGCDYLQGFYFGRPQKNI